MNGFLEKKKHVKRFTKPLLRYVDLRWVNGKHGGESIQGFFGNDGHLPVKICLKLKILPAHFLGARTRSTISTIAPVGTARIPVVVRASARPSCGTGPAAATACSKGVNDRAAAPKQKLRQD